MRRRIATTTAVVALSLVGLAAAPSAPGGLLPSPPGSLAGAEAAVTKSLSGGGEGGGNVSGSGSRLAGLLRGIAVPVVIVLAGILLIGTLGARNIGASVGIVVITFFGLIFLLSPSSVEGAAKEIARIVF